MVGARVTLTVTCAVVESRRDANVVGSDANVVGSSSVELNVAAVVVRAAVFSSAPV